ncbi:MAG: PhnD/SsuA/transferrin family substrate-binding protein, partial [Gemmatimonadales bacterium]|nr:PhnD/SsuA/transferrin family substrate-binding protein [Gemmatimonadales bacterium]
FMQYLGDGTGRRVVLKQRRTYEEVNELLARGELDLAFLCSAQYVETHDRFEARIVAVPVVGGET